MKKFENMPVTDRAGAVALATTAELVEWFNAHAESPVKKFADRKTAERRVLALLAEGVKAVKVEVDHSAANKRIAAAMPKLKTAKASSASRNVERAADNGSSEDRSAAVAATWMNPDVAAARSVRDHVLVNDAWHVSVRQAFIDLGLPLNEHIKFRAQLKRSRKAEAYGFKWSITNHPAGVLK